jgi:AMMECR1 domain-containing protein
MAGAAANHRVPIPREPKDIVITKDHVHYAFEVTAWRLRGVSPVPRFTFQDARCPADQKYTVYIIWHRPLRNLLAERGGPKIPETFTPPGRECRGFLTAKSETLSSAIRYAAGRNDRRCDPLTFSELVHLDCTVGLVHSFQRVDRSIRAAWEPATHGLALAGPNDNQDDDGPLRSLEFIAILLKEVAIGNRWARALAYEESVHNLLMFAPDVKVDAETARRNALRRTFKEDFYMFKACSAISSCIDWIQFLYDSQMNDHGGEP